jgi:hypothetical protein
VAVPAYPLELACKLVERVSMLLGREHPVTARRGLESRKCLRGSHCVREYAREIARSN